jgi:tetratricopeptide (TPR) repeat protein
MGLFDKLFNTDTTLSRDAIMQIGITAIKALQAQNFKLAADSFEKYFTSKGEGKYPEIDEDDASMLYNYSIAKFNTGDIKGAIVEATKSIQRKQLHQVFKERAKYYNEINDFENAIKDFTFCIQLHPEDKSYYLCERGIAYHNFGNTESAIQDFVASYKLGDKTAENILRENTNYFN